MKPIEALELTLSKVDELREGGIEVTIVNPTKGSKNPETVKKCSGPKNIPADKWSHVTFKVKSREEAQRVQDARNYLSLAGITFDTGGWSCGRDWELDWSFGWNKGVDEERKKAANEVDDIISGLSAKGEE